MIVTAKNFALIMLSYFPCIQPSPSSIEKLIILFQQSAKNLFLGQVILSQRNCSALNVRNGWFNRLVVEVVCSIPVSFDVTSTAKSDFGVREMYFKLAVAVMLVPQLAKKTQW